jgi:hypothetical protein
VAKILDLSPPPLDKFGHRFAQSTSHVPPKLAREIRRRRATAASPSELNYLTNDGCRQEQNGNKRVSRASRLRRHLEGTQKIV